MTRDINPAIGAMLRNARDWLMHEHSLFASLNLDPMLIGRGKATFAVDLPETFAGPDGKIHGSLLTLIMDSIFGLTVFTALDELKPIATINLRSDYLADGNIGDRVLCSADCYQIRNEVAFVNGDVRTEKDKLLLSSGSGAFMVGTRGMSKASRL